MAGHVRRKPSLQEPNKKGVFAVLNDRKDVDIFPCQPYEDTWLRQAGHRECLPSFRGRGKHFLTASKNFHHQQVFELKTCIWVV